MGEVICFFDVVKERFEVFKNKSIKPHATHVYHYISIDWYIQCTQTQKYQLADKNGFIVM